MSEQIVERPLVSITNVIFSFDTVTKQLLVLLLQRSQAPFMGAWGLPTTTLRSNESADAAALRLVKEKLGVHLTSNQTEQLGTFTNVGRVPGQRTLALTYMVYLPVKPALIPGAGARAVRWFAVTPRTDRDDLVAGDLSFTGLTDDVSAADFYQRERGTTQLAADHALIVKTALQRVRNRLNYAPTILRVLGVSFTLKRARELYALLERRSVSQIDNSNFRKTHGHLFEQVGFVRGNGSGRPARVYRLKD
ncbi:NUDIX domain-containing protein [Lactiplantibacillus garii]|uniref:NUDIX domain-containing protein n=1 Tax=Lactiplantibacillus garii TaxID=2306423 RepID=A0A3R8KNB4_9LACO|nr:NUDIX domain-containing protein [Lactiplantibacillus garii]RRK11543.1 NUDIX domain-containing protein [Lactiplantibacillus garii]